MTDRIAELNSVIAELTVRVARAEMERDKALDDLRLARDAALAWVRRLEDPEGFRETMTIMGIPARDVADIFDVVAEWRHAGGSPQLLEVYRELWRLRLKLGSVAAVADADDVGDH